MTRDDAICRWRDLAHTTVYSPEQARKQAQDIRRQVTITDGDVDAEAAYRVACGQWMYPEQER